MSTFQFTDDQLERLFYELREMRAQRQSEPAQTPIATSMIVSIIAVILTIVGTIAVSQMQHASSGAHPEASSELAALSQQVASLHELLDGRADLADQRSLCADRVNEVRIAAAKEIAAVREDALRERVLNLETRGLVSGN
jgi:hypothetical protein